MNPPHIQLAILSREYVLSRSIHAIAHLGIADHMSDAPISAALLAKQTDTVPELLERVLSFLSLYGLFNKTEQGYALTPLSYPLRSDDPHSIKNILGMVDESWWQSFAHLETTLRTGNSGFAVQNGCHLFDYLSQHGDKKNQFEAGLTQLAHFDDEAITKAFNFAQFSSLITVGKGKSDLAQAIQARFPQVTAIYQPFNPQFPTEFTQLKHADAYVLKGILHDFNDQEAVSILQALKEKMRKESALIIVEQVIPDTELPHTNKTMDIIMMVLVGGRQRTQANWQELIESAGFKLKQVTPTEGVYSVMEFKESYALQITQ